MKDVTEGTLNRLTSGHKDLIQEQVKIRSEFGNVNKELATKMNDNMVALNHEKRIIKEAERQLSSMTEAIATTLGKRQAAVLFYAQRKIQVVVFVIRNWLRQFLHLAR